MILNLVPTSNKVHCFWITEIRGLMLFWQRIAFHCDHTKCADSRCQVPNCFILEPMENIRLSLFSKGLNHDLHSSHVGLIKYSHSTLIIKQCDLHSFAEKQTGLTNQEDIKVEAKIF
jgi:hypothetical protein